MNSLTIDGRSIGSGHPTFVIAEIGVNHDGSLARAVQLVRHAAECGADAVKLQIFRAKSLMHSTSAFAQYQKEQCAADADPAAMLRRYELTPLDLAVVIAEIRRLGLVPLATPFSLDDVETAERLDLPAIKIASPDLVNYPLLERCAALGKPLLVSTGAATMSEVVRTVRWLNAWGTSFALLHCVSSYPAPVDGTNLCWITELQHLDVPVGYSDHTTEQIAGAAAVMLGACIVEKHLTHDRSAPGPDHAASADPGQFARYVESIRAAEKLRGRPGKRVLPIEQDVRRVSRQSLVLARPLPARHVLTVSDLVTQRPGTGLPASLLLQIVGRRTSRPLPAGTLLESDMIEAA